MTEDTLKQSLAHTLAQGIGAQVTAGDPSGSVWVSANAGTGKTRVLVDRISRLLLAGTPAHRILCLTFTRAAAAEMANRINASLAGWAVADNDELTKQITDLTGAPPEPDMLRRARPLFARVLDVPGGMKIQTLHGFCESLLGRFPIEAEVAPHFQAGLQKFADHPLVGEARGVGLIGALEIVADKATKTPFAENHLIGEQVVRAAQKNGLILRPIGESVIFAPPFIITKAEIDDMFARTAKVLDEIEAIVEKDGLRAAAVTAAAE